MEGEHERPPLRLVTGPEAGPLPDELAVVPWIDELVEQRGFGPRSMYVETCWLPVLGPTATWLYRRLGSWAEFNPDGLTVDLTDLSVSLGLGEGLGRHSLLARSLHRLAHFEAARWSGDTFQVRRALPPLPLRLARNLNHSSYRLHEEYVRRPPSQIPPHHPSQFHNTPTVDKSVNARENEGV